MSWRLIAAGNAVADRAILLDEYLLLFDQNNEKMSRKSIRATIVRTTKALSHQDNIEAQPERDVEEADTLTVRGQ